MGNVKERYAPVVIGVDSTVVITSDSVGGFLAKTSGTLTITRNNESGTTTVIVNAVAVTAGIYTPTPFFLGYHGATVTTAGGASGTLGV